MKNKIELLDPEWKYSINLYNVNWPIVQEWCEEYIGEFDVDWYKLGIDPVEFISNKEFYTTWLFKDEKKYIHFKLRWT